MPGEGKAPGAGKKHTRDPQIELSQRSFAVLKARELCEMTLLYLAPKRLKIPADV